MDRRGLLHKIAMIARYFSQMGADDRSWRALWSDGRLHETRIGTVLLYGALWLFGTVSSFVFLLPFAPSLYFLWVAGPRCFDPGVTPFPGDGAFECLAEIAVVAPLAVAISSTAPIDEPPPPILPLALVFAIAFPTMIALGLWIARRRSLR